MGGRGGDRQRVAGTGEPPKKLALSDPALRPRCPRAVALALSLRGCVGPVASSQAGSAKLGLRHRGLVGAEGREVILPGGEMEGSCP